MENPWDNPGPEISLAARIVVAIRRKDSADLDAIEAEYPESGDTVNMARILVLT